MIQVTAGQVVEELTKIVNAAGEDFTYEAPFKDDGDTMCYYAVEGKPSCIVGQLLVALGVPVDQLAQIEGNGAWTAIPRFVEMDEGLRRYLADLQADQDRGVSWGDAFQTFKGQIGVNA